MAAEDVWEKSCCLATVFIMNLSLNIVITRIAFVPNSHIIFLGHVQMVSQYGLAALVVSVLYYMTYKDKKIKMCGLVLLTVFTMLTTDADSAVFSALIIIIGFIVYKFKLYRVFFFKTEIYMFGMIAMNIVVVYLTAINHTGVCRHREQPEPDCSILQQWGSPITCYA